MPRVSVVLKDGTEIKVEGDNDAEWVQQKLTPNSTSQTVMLVVYYKETNKTEIRARFRPEEVVGFIIDPN